MSSGWIDISVPLENGMHYWPGEVPHVERFLSMSDGEMCNVTRMSLSAHTGTHMDAPLHFVDHALSIDQIPLDAVLGPCSVVEVDDPVAIHAHHLEAAALERRVLFKTRNSALCWSKPTFVEDYIYISNDAAEVLVARGVTTVGIDYLSVGGYFKDLQETHVTLLGAGIWIIEGLNLAHIVPGRYELACLPLKITGSDGAPARAALRPL